MSTAVPKNSPRKSFMRMPLSAEAVLSATRRARSSAWLTFRAARPYHNPSTTQPGRSSPRPRTNRRDPFDFGIAGGPARRFGLTSRVVMPPTPAEHSGREDAEPASDASLLRRYRRGEEDAATELYLRYAGRLRVLADTRASPELKQRVDPEDIVQSVFRTFFRRAAVGQYDAP